VLKTRRIQTLQDFSKHFPDVVSQQNEHAANATNPEQGKVEQSTSENDLLFVHRRSFTLSEGI